MQTSELEQTTLRGVLRRLGEESGNVAGAGLQFPRAAVQREVDLQLKLSAFVSNSTLQFLPLLAAESGPVPGGSLQFPALRCSGSSTASCNSVRCAYKQ